MVVAPPVAPPVAIKPVPVPVVVQSTRVEVADVANPTVRADVVFVPGSTGRVAIQVEQSAPGQVEVVAPVKAADEPKKEDKR